MSDQISLVCGNCEKPFQKERKEFDRQVRAGRKAFFCSLTCSANRPRKPDHSFRYILNTIRKNAKAKSRDCELSVDELKKLWQKQDGRCAYTGKVLQLPNRHDEATPLTASLDRICSARGYVVDNVEFVCLFINYGKNGFSKQQILEFLGN